MGPRSLAGRSTKEGQGKCGVRSWIGRHSYHSIEQNVKDKNLENRALESLPASGLALSRQKWRVSHLTHDRLAHLSARQGQSRDYEALWDSCAAERISTLLIIRR